MKEWKPVYLREGIALIDIDSAWGHIPYILHNLFLEFGVLKGTRMVALDIGVQDGYSTSALSNFFDKVYGVDTFRDDFGNYIPKPSKFYQVLRNLKDYDNIQLIPAYFEEFIAENIHDRYDLIHIDIVHNYKDTFDCGDWALQHSDCVLFHDTMSYEGVMRACEDLAAKHNYEFYNYPDDNGLGILVNKR